MHYIVHYTLLFHNQGGYYNSLILQALDLFHIFRNQYQFTVSFAEKFTRLDIRFGLTISYFLRDWLQRTVSLYSKTTYDWSILSRDKNWHLLCISYDLRRDPKTVSVCYLPPLRYLCILH